MVLPGHRQQPHPGDHLPDRRAALPRVGAGRADAANAGPGQHHGGGAGRAGHGQAAGEGGGAHRQPPAGLVPGAGRDPLPPELRGPVPGDQGSALPPVSGQGGERKGGGGGRERERECGKGA